MFYIEEYLYFKGINKSFNLYKTYTYIKSILNEIHSGYVAIFGVTRVLGFAYSYYKKLVERCKKCMYRKNSGYHFLDKRKFNRTGLITSVHSFIDYTDIDNNDSDDNIDNNKDKDTDDSNKVLNELKDNIIENLKDYIKYELKQKV